MTNITPAPWQVVDELIEQPSWGGRYIIDLKGLADDPAWAGKRVGQSYELARSSRLIDPATGQSAPLLDLIASDPAGWLGARVVERHGPDLSLLIKLTQAKGNSFQVHLPEGKSLGQWRPKPEAWFYLGPGLYTFGMRKGASFAGFAEALTKIDDDMRRLSAEVRDGFMRLDEARAFIERVIRERDPYQYVNVVEAATDDIVDLTAGGIHHSWEEDNARFPAGNLVYEVQVDVPDELCSMRGFDKGKFLEDGGIRSTHVADYLATIENDDAHNDLALHIGKPRLLADEGGCRVEALFRTPYFDLDRWTLAAGATARRSVADGFHHVFVHAGQCRVGDRVLGRGRSYWIPTVLGEYDLAAEGEEVVLLVTTLPLM